MLRHLPMFTIPTAISIAFFDATYFAIAAMFGFSGRDVVLGVIAGAAGGMCVLVAVLWQAGRTGVAEPALSPALGGELRSAE
jgi:hypothetical protein